MYEMVQYNSFNMIYRAVRKLKEWDISEISAINSRILTRIFSWKITGG